MFCKEVVLKNLAKSTGKDLCQSVFYNKVAKKETQAEMFSCEFCEISKNSFSYGTPRVAASAGSSLYRKNISLHIFLATSPWSSYGRWFVPTCMINFLPVHFRVPTEIL